MTAETWQDVFLTNPEYEQDDHFVAPVMSVAVQREASTATPKIRAKPVKGGSDWLMLAYPAGHIIDGTDRIAYIADEVTRWRELAVGDMIRVGHASNGGFTNWLTVLETVDVEELYNTTDTTWQIVSLDPNKNLNTVSAVQPQSSGYGTNQITHLGPATGSLNIAKENADLVFFGCAPGSLRAVRVNYAIDATSLEETLHTNYKFKDQSATAAYVTDATRGEVSSYYTTANDGVRYGGRLAERREQFYFPCYRVTNTKAGSLKLQMPSNVKQVRAIKLLGYTMIHRPSPGLHHAHEFKEDDWFAIRVKELRNDTVLSNNRHADGSLHVIHAPSDGEDLHAYEPNGISCSSFTPINLPSITVEVVDRQGQPANFGRMHLWLKVLTTCS